MISTLEIRGTVAIYDGGRIVVERIPSGWSIAYNDPNPETRYQPVDLSAWDRVRMSWWRWKMRRPGPLVLPSPPSPEGT